MKVVNRYMPEKANREHLNRERCNTAGSIYKVDLSCNRVSTYSLEHAKPEDYRFGNVFAFKSEAERALGEIPKLYAMFSKESAEKNNSVISGKAAYFILDNGNIAEIKREDMPEINRAHGNTGANLWTFEQYIKIWLDAGNCFGSLFQASTARDRIADIFENIKRHTNP